MIKSIGDKLVRLRFERPDETRQAGLVSNIKSSLRKLYVHSLMNRQSASASR